jgi:hypothetical protein
MGGGDLEPIGPIVKKEMLRLSRARNLDTIVDLRPPARKVEPHPRR